jgi:endonuclease YncB( thermonuclease family)
MNFGLFLVPAISLTVLAVPSAYAAQAYRVVKIADGDTLTALSADLQQVKCRLYGIDAPEKKQAYGQASKLSLAELSFGRTAQIDIVGRDRYGRAICRVAVAGVDVNKEQIARGMAWMYREYASDPGYSNVETVAQSRRIGLWREARPVPPWAFRRAKRHRSL